jgi:hypothetical protein
MTLLVRLVRCGATGEMSGRAPKIWVTLDGRRRCQPRFDAESPTSQGSEVHPDDPPQTSDTRETAHEEKT